MGLDVVVVGGAVRDEYYTLSNLPEPDGGAFVHGYEEAVGGVGANVAVALARLGRDVGLIARLGADDAPGLEAQLLEEGVGLERVRRGDEEPTYSMVLRDGAGERMVVTGGASVRNLRLREGDLDYCRRADAVFTYGYVPDPVVAGLLDADRPPLVFDLPGPFSELAGRGTERATVDRLAREAALFIAGEVATWDYLGCGPAAGLDRLRERGLDRAALTAGETGAHLLEADRTVTVPAFDVEAVDTTGAGDAFTAGLVDAWLLDGRDPADAGRFAAAVAALNCQADTAQRGLPTRAETEAFLDERPA